MKRRNNHSRHVTATITVEREVSVPYGAGLERDEIELTLTGIAHPGCDETPPSYASGGERGRAQRGGGTGGGHPTTRY